MRADVEASLNLAEYFLRQYEKYWGTPCGDVYRDAVVNNLRWVDKNKGKTRELWARFREVKGY